VDHDTVMDGDIIANVERLDIYVDVSSQYDTMSNRDVFAIWTEFDRRINLGCIRYLEAFRRTLHINLPNYFAKSLAHVQVELKKIAE
jgi:hypothetical protein